jgi:uncharacterized membrane protein
MSTTPARTEEPSIAPSRGPMVALGGLLVVWGVIMFRLGELRHGRFATFGFDLGIYDQAGWLVAFGENPFMTVRGLDVWGHHGTFVFYLLAPGYWLGWGPGWLLAMQVLSQVVGAAALYLLVRDTVGRAHRALGVAAAAVLLLNPTNQWMVWEFFHPESFAIGPLLLAWWAARTHRWGWFAGSALVAATCKEDIVLGVAMMGVAIALERPFAARTVRIGLATTCLALGWYLLVTKWMIPARNPYGAFYEQQFFTDFGTSTGAVLRRVVTDPLHFLRFVTEQQPTPASGVAPDTGHLEWYRMMLLPTLAIGLLRPRAWLPALPMVGVALLADQGHNWVRDHRFHYSAIVAAFSVVAAVEVVGWAHERTAARTDGWRALPIALMTVLVGAGVVATQQWGVFPEPLPTLVALGAGTAVGVTALVRWCRRTPIDRTRDVGRRQLATIAAFVGAVLLGVALVGPLTEPNAGGPGRGYWPWAADEGLVDLVLGIDATDPDRSPTAAAKARAVATIGDDDVVSAVYNVTPHLADRRFVYQFPNPWVPENWGVQNEDQHDPATVEWIVLDRALLGSDPNSTRDRAIGDVIEHLLAEEFDVVFETQGVVLARRIAPPTCIPDPTGAIARTINDQRYDTSAPPSTGTVCPVT